MAEGDSETGQSEAGSAARSSWGRVVPIALLLMGLAALLLLLPFGSAILSDVHKRNQRDLGIAASGLESWSDAIGAVAIGNFIRGRVGGLSEDERDYRDGWKLRATLRHPALREYRVVYATGSAESCDAIAARVRAREGGLPFVRNYLAGGSGMLKLIGRFPVAEIYARDQRAGLQGANVSAYLRDIEPSALPDGDVAAGDLQVCYGAVIPVDGLLQTRANQGFTALLVASPEGAVLTQVGPERLPLSSIEALKPEASASTGDVLGSAGKVLAKASGLSTEDIDALGQTRAAPARLIETLDPVELSVGGRSYYAYARPFFPPADTFADCRPADVQKEAVGPGERGHCYVVGLMPKAEVWRQLADPPLLLTICLALAIGMVLVLLPAARLILLGPGEAIGRLEMAMLALGIPAAASLATLLVLVLTDVSAHRAAAEAQGGEIAEAVAAQAGLEISSRVAAAGNLADRLAALPRQSMNAPATSLAEERWIAQMPVAANAPFSALPAGPREQLPSADVQRCLRDAMAKEWSQPPPPALPKGWSRATLPPGFVTSGIPLVADPRPMRCVETPLCRASADAATGLPLLELAGLVDASGRRLAGLRAVSCRAFPGGRTELSGRDYFRRLAIGHPGLVDGQIAGPRPRPYSVAQVMALQDGIPQTVIALKTDAPGWHDGQGAGGSDAYLVATTSLPALVRPVLPPPYELMVVDTRDPSLPVIMHREAGRAGAERLDEMVDAADDLRDLLRAAAADPGKARRFERFYDGAARRFSAAGIAGTRWVVVVHHDKDLVDDMPVQTGWRALVIWAAMSVLFGGAWLGWLMLVGQRGRAAVGRPMDWLTLGNRGWPRLWPQEGHTLVYRRLGIGLGALAAVALAAIAVLAGLGMAAPAAVVLALAVRGGAAIWLHVSLRTAPKTVDVLRPETQIRFARLAVVLILCLSVAPMLAFWSDSRELMAAEKRAELVSSVTSPVGRMADSARAHADLRWVLGLANIAMEKGAPLPVGLRLDRDAEVIDRPSGEGFSLYLQRLQSNTTRPTVATCSTDLSGDTAVLCGPDLKAVAWSPPAIWRTAVEPPLLLLLLAVAAGLGFMLWTMLQRTLAALCGFGIALEAVTYPNLFLGNLWNKPPPKAAVQTLNRKSLLVNAPWTIMPMLERMGGPAGDEAKRRLVPFDLSGLDAADGASLPEIKVARGDIIELYGLELVLADPPRRLMALRAVEELARQVDKLEREDDLTDPFLLFFAPTAPMDRILDAYERERDSALEDGTRENLRWARLFEDFATFHFRPIETTVGHTPEAAVAAHQARWDQLGNFERQAIETVYAELRWLSPRVVNGCINEEVMPGATLLDSGILPLGAADVPPRNPYPALYQNRLMAWALLRQFAGPTGTLAYLRAQFIEHYQRVWSGSTRAERLVLHHLAEGRFVNMAAGLAFASLLRRGVIVLDPEPRLMNESFAMFVRQAEKLDRIAEWKKDMPAGAWVRAKLPILLAIAGAALLLVGLVVAGGQQPAKLLPVLAAGLPALLAAMHRMMRAS